MLGGDTACGAESKETHSSRREVLSHRAVDHVMGRLVACLAFFSIRFSFSDFPDFLDWCWRGDLSAINCSSRWWIVVDPSAARGWVSITVSQGESWPRTTGWIDPSLRSVEATGLQRVDPPLRRPRQPKATLPKCEEDQV
jgi:hypothetical protein